jgi:hypothetical protein
MLDPGAPLPAGLVDSAAGTLWGTGLALAWLALPVFVPAGLYTLWAYWQRPHRGPDSLLGVGERGRRIAGGFAFGAMVTATCLAALGLVVALFFHYGNQMPAWPEGARVPVFAGALGLAALLVAAGTALHVQGGRGEQVGRALLWLGAGVLTVAGLLDSFSTTSLSGTTGTYAASTTGNFNGTLLTHWSGLGSFLLPAGVLALFLAVSVTHIPLPQQQHVPRRHRRTSTIRTTHRSPERIRPT